ncbi:MAG: four helix bundle protein [Armatimonadota bacterium]
MTRKRPQTYKDLEVYKLAFAFGVDSHRASMDLAKYEMWEEGSQLRRSAKAVGAAIAEGFGRRAYKADFVRYLTYAQAELNEARHHIEMLRDTNSMCADAAAHLLDRADELGRKLHRFTEAVERGHKTSPAEGVDGAVGRRPS